MESSGRDELAELTRVAELTSDAVVACGFDGSIFHVNSRFLELAGVTRERVIDADIKDLLFSDSFERSSDHRLPFSLDGSDCTLMLKLSDGSFIPVLVRAIQISGSGSFRRRILKRGARGSALLTVRSLEERYAYDRQMRRVLTELQAANKRLSGTLSVIMSTIGAESLPALLDTVLNKLVDALEADGSEVYFSESGGFKLRGVSKSLERDYVPEFIPFGVGVPTYVLRKGSSCRLSVVRPGEDAQSESGSIYDLDARKSRTLRSHYMPPYKTLIAVPLFFGTQVLGVMELGWKRPTTSRAYDVNVIEVVCDYLSIELISLVTSMRSNRAAELGRSLNQVRDALYAAGEDQGIAWAEAMGEVRRVLACHVCPIAYNTELGVYELDFEGGSRVPLPGDIDRLFFSTTAPAARVNPFNRDAFPGYPGAERASDADLENVRITRVERLSRVGTWLASHGLPDQGVFIELDRRVRRAMEDDAGSGTVLVAWGSTAPSMLLLLRDDSQEPIDDVEFDYLVRLAHDFELISNDATERTETTRIAQTLQAGMRSSLGEVPGIISDSLYSSATRQALVGGDFYTLMRLPDDRAVMILGDVSGKGIEAASMSALVKTALTAYAWEGMSPVAMVRALNTMLMSFSRVETFATMFVAKLDLRRGEGVYCSAGHPPSMLLHTTDAPGGSVCEAELLSTQSGVVGAFETMAFQSGSFTFGSGDVLFMYTDGAIEARDAAGEFFGEQRLRDILLAHGADGARGLCQVVLDELDAFTDSALEDDIALVALEFA